MQFSELLEQIRTHYVSHLLETIAEKRKTAQATVVHEPALRNEEGEIVGAGHLDTPMRVDMAMVRDGEVIDSLNVDTEEMLAFEQFTFDWPENNLSVTVEPFQWNWLQVQTSADPQPDDWHAVRNWYLKWFGEDDPAVDQLAGAVHYLDDPQIDAASIQLTMDLGSSPVQCFEELLDALGEFGAEKVRIGQFTRDDQNG